MSPTATTPRCVIRWGDPVLPGAPAFDPTKQTAAAQKLQFGYNNDYLGYLPMPGAANPSRHGLLVVNHEYTNEELMFPGIGADQMTKEQNFAKMTKELVDIEMAAHGGAVIEIRRDTGKWQVVAGSNYARRIDSDTADGDHRPGRRPRPAEDQGRSERPPRARHGQQLRRRRHALGDVAQLRGEFPRLLLGQARRRPSGGAELQTLRRRRTTGRHGASGTIAST